ncbi:MAG: GTPase Era [Bacteroidetes bacterium]|nr:MAG: GTPase Era [Bacteroidota bacterium]
MKHRSGFVNIIGRPNAGKSTLMNTLVGERMSIITAKPQTTRHRIIGLLSGDDFQIVFSDTPGIIANPSYEMQKIMNTYVRSTFEDADIMLLVAGVDETYTADEPVLEQLRNIEVPKYLVLNKIDTSSQEEVIAKLQEWQQLVPFDEFFPVSALHRQGTEGLLQFLIKNLPEGPAYYPKDQLSDRQERFFVSEIIREQILEQYQQEIPYSTEVIVDSFKETTTKSGAPLIRIHATIYVMRKSQKNILIGNKGSAIKALGMAARKSLESFLETKVFLELHVKVRDNWRDDEQWLKRFGY